MAGIGPILTPPGGSTTQVQYNNAGSFGGASGWTWDGTNTLLATTQAFGFRSSLNKIYSDAADTLSVLGNTTTKIGVAGDTVLGDSTLRTVYPSTAAKIDLGKSGNEFNKLWLANLVMKYNNISTAGLGLSAIYASYSTTGNTNAVTNAINYTPPATAGRYRISGVCNVTAWTTPASFTVVVVYKDDSGTTQTETLAVTRGSTGAVVAAVTTVNRYYFTLPCFAINNAATAITLSTTGTFTGSPTYNLSAILEQLA